MVTEQVLIREGVKPYGGLWLDVVAFYIYLPAVRGPKTGREVVICSPPEEYRWKRAGHHHLEYDVADIHGVRDSL